MPEAKPLRLSWSGLKTWEECQARGYLKSQGKRAEIVDIRTYFPGTVIDRVMREWLDADVPEPGAMPAAVARIFDREEKVASDTGDGVVRWRNLADREQTRQWCQDAVTRLEPILAAHVVPYEYQTALRFAVPFTVPYLDGTPTQITLLGEMDLLVRKPGSWLRVKDLKGTKSPDYWRQTYPQLIFYELAAFAMTGQWADQSWLIQPMCEQPYLAFVFTLEHRREMAQRIVRWAEGQWRGVHAPKASAAGCDRCEVKHACPRYDRIPGTHRVPLSISNGRQAA